MNYDIRDIINIVENEGCIFYCDVSNYEELGEYLIENNYLKVPIEFEKYIDKEKLATDYTKNKNIYFCKSGHAIENKVEIKETKINIHKISADEGSDNYLNRYS